jgi:hypothetical protein
MNAADQPNGGYTYAVEAQGCVSPSIMAAVSRMTHGTAGQFENDLWSAEAIEHRAGGPTTLVVTFDYPIQGSDGWTSATSPCPAARSPTWPSTTMS